LEIDDEVVFLDLDGERLGDVGPLHQVRARLNRDLELAGLHRLGVAPGLAGADVELPAVPRAANELAGLRDLVGSSPVRSSQDHDHAPAQLGAHVRAAVGDGEVLSVDVEQADLAAHGGDDLAGAGRHIAGFGQDAAAHARPYTLLALSRNTLAFCSAVR